MRKFNSDYIISESDDVLVKENAVHSDLDRRMDAVEAIAAAFKAGNRADVDAILASLNTTFADVASQAQTILDAVNAGLATDNINESPDKLFLTTERQAAIVASILGAVSDDGNTLAKLYALIAARALPTDISDAITGIVNGAPAGRNTLKALSDLIAGQASTIANLLTSPTISDASLTGAPIAPTPSSADNSNKVATTAFVAGAISAASGLSVAVLQTLSAAQKATARANASAAPWEAMASQNLIMNPRFEVAQMNAVGSPKSLASSASYINDGWIVTSNGMTVSAQSVLLPFASRLDLDHGLFISVTTPKPTLAATDTLSIRQPVEGFRLRSLRFGTASACNLFLAATVKVSVAGTYYLSLRNGATDRSYVVPVSLSANVETFFSCVIPGDTAGIWATDNSVGLHVTFAVGVGSSYVTAPANANKWLSGSFIACSDVTNLGGVAGATVSLSDVILLGVPAGETDPAKALSSDRLPFFRRPLDLEKVICKRYWQSLPLSTYCASSAGSYDASLINVVLPVSMRATPAIAYTPTGGNWSSLNASSGSDVSLFWFAGSPPVGAYMNFVATFDARL